MSREALIILQFCEKLQVIERREVRVTSWPDRERPGHGGCDAIVSRGGEAFALEHTSIDSYRGQREDSARFIKVVAPLEQSVEQAHPDSYVRIVVPVHAIPTGRNWSELATTLAEGCIETIAELPFGSESHEVYLKGVPFRVLISREKVARNPGCHVMRLSPPNRDVELQSDMCRAIRDKGETLAPYKRAGKKTILLLESDDIALVNAISLAQAFSTAAASENLSGIDEVYLAEADREPVWFYPVKMGGRIYPEVPEFEEYRSAQYELTYYDEQ